MKEFDVIIVGAGPAGLMSAKLLAEKNLKVLCLDKKPEVGVPKQCGEGLSLKNLKLLGIEPSKEFCSQEIRGACLYSPSEKRVDIRFNEVSGHILERKSFEKFLAAEAANAGAKIQMMCPVTDVKRDSGKVTVTTGGLFNQEYSCKILIGADGPQSFTANKLGKEVKLDSYDIDSGFQYEMAGLDFKKMNLDKEMLHIFFGTGIAPRGYCLTGDSEIITRHSIKPISEVAEGEQALTKTGWVDVEAKSIREYKGKVISITPSMIYNNAKLTPDHLVYVWNKKQGFVWKKAGELIRGNRKLHGKGDYLVYPVADEPKCDSIILSDYYKKGILEDGFLFPKGRNRSGAEFKYKHSIKNKLKLTSELLELIGFFIAEGSTNSNGIILANTDKELIDGMQNIGEKAFGFKGSIWLQKRRNPKYKDCYQLHFASVIIKKVFAELFGVGCKNKKIPAEFLGLSVKGKKSLLKGLFLGDGYVEKSSEGLDKLAYTTTSKHLIYDLFALLASIGVVGAINMIKKKNAYRMRIRGKQLNKLENIFGKYKTGNRDEGRSFRLMEGNVLLSIRSLNEELFEGKVYDIQTNGSFCPGFLVHNCWVFPKKNNTANVGVGIGANEKGSAKEYLDNWIKSHAEWFASASIIEVNSGTIPVGGLLDSLVDDNLVLVGDAAHQVNPIHGGGIGAALEASLLASKVIEKAFKEENFSKEFLEEYTKEWYAVRGNQFQKLVKIRHMLEEFSDQDFESLANSFSGDDVMKITRADLLGSAKIVSTKLLKNPGLLKLMLKYLKG